MVVLSSLMVKKLPIKNIVLILLLILLGIIVTRAYYTRASHAKPSQSEAIMASYRCEMLLRMTDAVSLLHKRLSAKPVHGTSQFILEEHDALIVEAQRLLKQAMAEQPDDMTFLVRRIILESAINQDVKSDLSKLDTLTSTNFVKLIRAVYKPDMEQLDKKLYLNSIHTDIDQILTKDLGNGWFKERVLLRVYTITDQSQNYQNLLVETENKTWNYVLKLLVLGLAAMVSILLGLIIIIWQLFFFKKNRPSHIQTDDAVDIPPEIRSQYNWQLVAFIFLLWFFTQILVGLCTGWLKKFGFNLAVVNTNPIASALSIAFIYLLSNGSVLLYIYIFAIRPHSTKFWEGLQLKFKVNNYGPAQLITAGLLAWFAALPIVMSAYFISSKMFGPGGSSNPIIAVVMEAAHTNSFVAIILFYFTLGILAPICEECLFRGFFYRYLRGRFNPLFSTFLSAALFSVAHLDPGAVLPLFCLGSIFAYLFEITDSIVPSVIAHGLWNSGTFTLVLLLFGS